MRPACVPRQPSHLRTQRSLGADRERERERERAGEQSDLFAACWAHQKHHHYRRSFCDGPRALALSCFANGKHSHWWAISTISPLLVLQKNVAEIVFNFIIALYAAFRTMCIRQNELAFNFNVKPSYYYTSLFCHRDSENKPNNKIIKKLKGKKVRWNLCKSHVKMQMIIQFSFESRQRTEKNVLNHCCKFWNHIAAE